MQNAYMAKEAAVTIRLPENLKRRLAARAKREHRSLSAQVVADLESVLEKQPEAEKASGKFLGLFEGTPVPSDRDIDEVRGLLWGRLGGRVDTSVP
jgi:plasmid stability protein